MGFKRSAFVSAVSIGAGMLSAHAAPRIFVEDFTSIDQADLALSTGLWDAPDGIVRAKVVADGDATRPLEFGLGGDGDLVSTAGYAFDTSAHPIYEFRSVSITGGTVSVTGTQPLIIRSLGAVTITPPINVSGSSGNDGTSASQATALAGANGGTARTSLATGGTGGISQDSTSVNREGTNGMSNTGVEWVTTLRRRGNMLVPEIGAPSPAQDGFSSQLGSGSTSGDFDAAGVFIAGAGGGAGGAYLDASPGGSARAGGAGGGGGGGAIHITAAGLITLGAAPTAAGGSGGNRSSSPGATLASQCSGAGGGGAGGVIWLQSLHAIATTSDPLTTGGATGAGIAPCNIGTYGAALDGLKRGDQGTGGALWSDTATCGASSGCATQDAAPNLTSTVVSRPYDLKTFNAFFPQVPNITQSLSGGAIQVLYAGSPDGAQFSDETPTLSDLSYKNHRYLRIKIAITTAGAIGPSPSVDRITFAYEDAGPGKLDVRLGAGCGSIQAAPWVTSDSKSRSSAQHDSHQALNAFALFTAFYCLLWYMLGAKLRHRQNSRPV